LWVGRGAPERQNCSEGQKGDDSIQSILPIILDYVGQPLGLLPALGRHLLKFLKFRGSRADAGRGPAAAQGAAPQLLLVGDAAHAGVLHHSYVLGARSAGALVWRRFPCSTVGLGLAL